MDEVIRFPENIIFKYGEFKDLQRTIEDLSLKFSSANDFNDPFECEYRHFHSHKNKNGKPIFPRRKDGVDAPGAVRELMDKLFGIIKVSCFSKTSVQPLMWAHYANKHTGVCYCFNRDSLFPDIYGFDDVQYSSKLPKLHFIEAETSTHMLNEQALDILLTKSDAWGYEKEIRCHVGSQKPIHFYKPNGLEALIVGCKASHEQRAEAVGLVEKYNEEHKRDVKIYHALKHGDNYELKIGDGCYPSINRYLHSASLNEEDPDSKPLIKTQDSEMVPQ